MAQRFNEKLYSLEEYLKLERQSQTKHEYFQGRIYQMAGGSPDHSLIASNVSRLLGNALEDQPCRVYNSDLQIQVSSNGLVTYPDVSVVCGPVEYGVNDSNLVTNPRLIVEVLSPSTASYDQTTKFELYKGLGSLSEYLLVDSRSIKVISYHKLGPSEWVQRTYSSIDDQVILESLGVKLELSRIYSKVEFEPSSQAAPLRDI